MRVVAAIEKILRDQVSSYRTLLDLLNRERASLVNIREANVEELSKEKDTIVMKLRLLEEERQRLLQEYAETHNVTEDINLEKLGELTGNSTFLSLRSQLLSLLQSIEELNRFNTVLINRSLQYLRTTNNFFHSFSREYQSPESGVLLSKET